MKKVVRGEIVEVSFLDNTITLRLKTRKLSSFLLLKKEVIIEIIN